MGQAEKIRGRGNLKGSKWRVEINNAASQDVHLQNSVAPMGK